MIHLVCRRLRAAIETFLPFGFQRPWPTLCGAVGTLLLWVGLLIPAASKAADAELRGSVLDAARKLGERPAFAWKTVVRVEGPGPGRGSSSFAMNVANGYATVSATGSGGGYEVVRKGGKSAVLMDGNWMTPETAVARMPGAGVSGGLDLKSPAELADEWARKGSNFQPSGDEVTADLEAGLVADLVAGNRAVARGAAPIVRDPKGKVSFRIREGMLVAYTLTLSAVRAAPPATERQTRTISGSLTESTPAAATVHPDAAEIIEAQIAGRAPAVFVPEPGFRKLFNGRDLTGWAGRAEHWAVKDGAIVGRTTKENPARGNNFLIAKSGEKNLIVDDFELRLEYRIVADNNSGFANSGIQYRSKDLGNFVVGGYQADFEAGSNFSGILYDEAGGAGGRGIMAQRGELVSWDPKGQRRVTGSLGASADIQRKIRANDWNEYVVIAEGPRLQHFINGVQTVGLVDETEGKRLKSGVLALQLHAGEPMTVQFRNIRIRTLGTPDVVGGANIKLARDFRMELLYTVPRETQGSWVAMCVDPKGRLIVSDQNGALHRVTLPAVSGEAVKTEKIDLDVGGAHGLLYAFDSLYVAVNEGSRPHGVYRVRDTDGDDRFDKVELLRQVQAGGEHGLHSLVPSPDGKSIYVVIGNQSSLTEMASSRVPKIWGEDDLLPRLPTGFMDDSYAPQGYISRMDPDGRNWELISVGLRNEFDVAFNREGELFTYDADMEWDIGEPWYRPTRVNHVISGAEFGFRNGNGKWPDHYVDSFGSVVNIGPGSPTGITFGYGAKFPAKYQDALYLADWSFGKIRAVHLKPSGASYVGEFEEFISGQPFPVTDFLIHPRDGSMLIAVGGRGAQSALYRVTYVGAESTAAVTGSAPLTPPQALRRKLEAFHGRRDPAAVDVVWPYLGDADRAIRFAARTALEWQDPSSWRDRALAERDPGKAIAALVALARLSGKDGIHRRDTDPAPEPGIQARLLGALDAIQWAGLGQRDRVDLLRAYCLVFIRTGQPDAATRERLAARLEPWFPANRPEIDALLARLLIYLEAPEAATKVVAALKVAPTQEQQIDFAVALRSLKTGWTKSAREDYFQWFNKAETYRGGNTFASSLRRAKANALELLSDSDKDALKPVLEAKVERKSPRDVLSARTFSRAWKVDELVPIVERGLKGGRSFERGRQLYGAVACAACHRFVNEGGSVGPELTGVVGRFSVHDLLEAMVEPSKVISDQYEAIVIRKKDGDMVTGRIGNLSAANINVVEDMFDPGRMTNVRRQDIESMEPSKVSMMPEGLLNSLKEDEIQDLVAYLISRGDPEHPVYR